MTQSPQGGPAQATYQTTGRSGVIGRQAVRVVQVTDDRPTEGGPQQAAYFVSDAEIESGEFVALGNKPLPIVKVNGAAGAVYPAIAVYDVTGKPDDYQPPQDQNGNSSNLPQVSSATLLLDLRASQLALSDGDPVSTWPDASGNGHHFTQSSPALRPIYLANFQGAPCIHLPSADPDYIAYHLVGGDFADDLPAFAVIIVAEYDGNNIQNIINRQSFASQRGWSADVYYSGGNTLRNSIALNGSVDDYIDTLGGISSTVPAMAVHTLERLPGNVTNAYVNGDNSNQITDVVGNFTSASVAQPVRIGMFESPDFGTFSGWIRSILMYQITDVDNWPTDRAAIEAWLATNP